MFKGKVKQSEWMKGLLAAEELYLSGVSLDHLRNCWIVEGGMADIGFRSYITHIMELENKGTSSIVRVFASNRTQHNIPRVTYE